MKKARGAPPEKLDDRPKPTPRGEETKRRILAEAVEVASKDGLEGLTIGHLADSLAMSKAGLFAHFGSKEELQLATVDAARSLFVERVGAPTLLAPPGLPRLLLLCDGWLAYSESLSGGCFFAGASAEFDNRPGVVRDRIESVMRDWMAALESGVREAQQLGHLRPDLDAPQLAFELNAYELGANWARQLLRDRASTERARSAIHARLTEKATPSGRRVLKSYAVAG